MPQAGCALPYVSALQKFCATIPGFERIERMTFQELLDELAEAARSNRDKGTQFEKLIANYLLTDPQYADRLTDVWLWEEWPDRWSTDVGIDLVARERGTGEYWC